MFWCTVSCSYNEINHAADQTKYWIQLSLLIFRSLWSIKEEYVLCSKIAAVEERLLFYFRINSQVMSKKLINTQNKVRKQDYLNYYCYRLWKVNICVCYWQTIYRRRKTVTLIHKFTLKIKEGCRYWVCFQQLFNYADCDSDRFSDIYVWNIYLFSFHVPLTWSDLS